MTIVLWKRLLAAAIVLVLGILGFSQASLRIQGRIVEICTFGDWPLEWAVRTHFSRKQPELRSLLDFVSESPEVATLSVTPAGLRASLQEARTEPRHELDEPNIREAIVSIEAQLVNIYEDGVDVFLGSESRGPLSYAVSYFHPLANVGVPDCDGISREDRPRIGACMFQLDSSWAAVYKWYPEDLDELERAVEELQEADRESTAE